MEAQDALYQTTKEQTELLREDLGQQLVARGKQQSQIEGLGLVVAHLMRKQEEVRVQREQAGMAAMRLGQQLRSAQKKVEEWRGKVEEVKGTMEYMQRQAAQVGREKEESMGKK